jgi:hypothetical protein
MAQAKAIRVANALVSIRKFLAAVVMANSNLTVEVGRLVAAASVLSWG